MARLFIEILCEEIPARMQRKGAQDFLAALQHELMALGMPTLDGSFFCGPRRLSVCFNEVSTLIPDRILERRGPKIEGGDGPLQGFLASTGLKKEELEVRETPKGTFYFAHHTQVGGPLKKYLPDVIEKAIKSIPWPAAMTWAWGTVPWVRPIKSVMCFLDQDPVTFEFSFGEQAEAPRVVSGTATLGHRFLHEGNIVLTEPESYEKCLEAAYVMVDQDKRRALIWQQVQERARAKNLSVVEDISLLEEVTGLVEWPVIMMGTIEEAFMVLPEEVLMTSMRVHQRYFALRDQTGALAPSFIFVANIPGIESGKAIIQGNERVLRARLSDALFFYTQDQKKPLQDYTSGLENIVFHGKLGTLAQKSHRLQSLSGFIAQSFKSDHDDLAHKASLAASLCKLDLMTDMVKEFPELQGIMGTYYAGHQGYDPDVATAIREHYLPKLMTDGCPTTHVGTSVALADRIDTLVGFFGVGIHPTSSKDPFALRRAILGIIRMLEGGGDVYLPDTVGQSYDLYEGFLTVSKEETLNAIRSFFEERLKVYWRDQGLSLSCIQSVLERSFFEPLTHVKSAINAFEVLVGTPEGAALVSLYKRAAHMTPGLCEKDKDTSIDDSLFQDKAENALYAALNHAEEGVQRSLENKHYAEVLGHLMSLKEPMDIFFTSLMIMDPDSTIRANRLALLKKIQDLFEKIADFSCFEGG